MTARNAGSPCFTGMTSSETIRPCAGGMSFQRHDRPVRSGALSGRRGLQREAPGLHRALGPGESAAREHRIRHMLRRPEARDARRQPFFVDGCHRHQRGAQREIELVACPRRRCRQHRRGGGPIACRHREARAVAAENKGELAARKSVAEPGDHRGAGGVHRLVAACGNRLGRIDDVGEADQPVIGKRPVARRIHDVGESFENRQSIVKVGVVRHGLMRPRDELGKAS